MSDIDRQPSTSEQIPPSRTVDVVMRPMTKVLNPVIARFAGRHHFAMAAELHHRGRRSGREYVTPVGARLVDDTFWIPLTFGNQSDWSRNVRALGHCTIRADGHEYLADTPELVNRSDISHTLAPAFNPLERTLFRILGIKQFLRLRVVSAPITDLPRT